MPFYCDFKKSKIKTNVKIVNLANRLLFKILLILFYLIGIASLSFIVLEIVGQFYLTKFEFFILALEALSFLFFISLHIYYKGRVKNPKIPQPLIDFKDKKEIAERVNLADYLSLPSFSVLWKAEKESKESQIDNKYLLRLLLEEDKIKFIFKRAAINIDEFEKGLREYRGDKQKDLSKEEITRKALEIAIMETHDRIEIGDILAVLAFTYPYLGKILFDLNLKPEDFMNIIYWETVFWREKEQKKFNPDMPRLSGGIGRDWASGYTKTLSRFAKDITRSIGGSKSKINVVGYQEEVNRLEKALVRANSHNALLVGESGAGKKTIVMGLAKRISRGITYRHLAYRHIMELDINFLLAGASSPGEIINRLAGVLNDAVAAGNVILFIDNIHALFGGGEGSKVGAIDAAQVIIPYLEHPGLFFIATTSTSSYHQYIETKKAISEKFEKIEVVEPDKFQVIRILENIVPEIERQVGIVITYEALKSIVELSDRYLYSKPFPEKATNLLNDVVVYTASQGKKTVMITEHVEEIISKKTNIPVGAASGGEKEKLLNLEKILHQRVIGQEEAVKVISNAMRRARAGMASSKKPIGTFMFLGPTGVGKTETCKALAEAYFGSEDSMIRFDMSEYQDIAGIYQLIGAPQGTPEAQSGGKLTNAVRDNPFSLILFDELEKAHPDILNLFLQVFDEGWLTDSLGRKVKFNNAIIIATSNAGAQLIQESIKQGLSSKELKSNLMEYLQKEGIFKPEFLNRFTSVVNFNPLTQEQVFIIAGKLVKALTTNLEREKGIVLEVNQEAIEKLARLGYDPLMGARPIQRVIQKKVEDILARRMLSGEIGRGSILNIGAENIDENDQ